MVAFLRKIVDSFAFNAFILAVILGCAVLVGLETYPEFAEQYRAPLDIINNIIISIFVIEVVLKIGACGREPWKYFADPWNVFDFIIVVICLMPFDESSHFVMVARLTRVIRALRLVTRIPRLQMLVGALVRSMPSIAYVGILLGLIFYVYGVMGTFLFRENDPQHFGSLDKSLITMFEVATFEKWVDILEIAMYGSDKVGYDSEWAMQTFPLKSAGGTRVPDTFPIVAPIFFVTFIFFGTYIILNLCVGVVVNGMQEAQEEHHHMQILEHRLKHGGSLTMAQELEELNLQLSEIKDRLDLIRRRATMVSNGDALPSVTTPLTG